MRFASRAVGARRAGEGDLEFVIVPVAVGVAAQAEGAAVGFLVQRRVVKPMRGGELESLAEPDHGKLPCVDAEMKKRGRS